MRKTKPNKSNKKIKISKPTATLSLKTSMISSLLLVQSTLQNQSIQAVEY
jgi:hypothetical protein